MYFLLFFFGAAIGSFLNVIALRYRPERFLLSAKSIGGRSRCPKCRRTLRWFELVPLASFTLQGGRCRRCRARLSSRYPIVEILSGLIFVFVPVRLANFQFPIFNFPTLSILWILFFLTLLLVFLVDMRLSIIPDEANIFLMALAILLLSAHGGLPFSGSYGGLFGLQGNVWLNHIFAAIAGGAFFGLLILVTKGRGMGLGDLKLIIPLGFLFGWPAIIFLAAAAFILGAAYGVYAIWIRGKNMKSAVPFGPFIVAAAALVFFFGSPAIDAYFGWLLR